MTAPDRNLPPLTPWFPPSVYPVRPGVYEAEHPDGIPLYRRWTGQHWIIGGRTVRDALFHGAEVIVPLPWRGLSQPVER